MTADSEDKFPGFKAVYKKDFFTYPKVLEQYWKYLTGSEQKVLDYILRQTLGYQKTTDRISYSQFVSGNGKNSRGAGVSKAQVARVLRTLEEKGYITVIRKERHTSVISLRIADDSNPETDNLVECSDTTAELINLFKPVALHRVYDFFRSKLEVQALDELVAMYGTKFIKQCIEVLPQTNVRGYMPIITSPTELKTKLPKLLASIELMQMQHDEFLDFKFSGESNDSTEEKDTTQEENWNEESDDDDEILF